MSTTTIKIDDIEEIFDVREELDKGRISLMAEVYKYSAEKMPPLKVALLDGTRTVLVDGRHRLTALRSIFAKEATVVYSDKTSEDELFIEAIQANEGTAKPFTYSEIVKLAKELLKKGKNKNIIIATFSWLPQEFIAEAINDGKRAIETESCRAIYKHITSGENTKTLTEWCAEYGIKLERYLSQRKLEVGESSTSNPKETFKGMKGSFTKKLEALIDEIELAHLAKIEEAIQCGDMFTRHLVDYTEHMTNILGKTLQDAKTRNGRYKRRQSAEEKLATAGMRKAAKKLKGS